MEDVFIDAVASKNMKLVVKILTEKPKLVIDKCNSDIIRKIKSIQMASADSKFIGRELIKFYKVHRISILAHAIKERKKWTIIKKIMSNNKETVDHASYDGLTPLIYAVKTNKNIKIIRYLLSKNCDVNECNFAGQSPLHFARRPDVVKLLIQKGAYVNCVDNSGSTPLMNMIQSGSFTTRRNIRALFQLLRCGADTNQRNIKGQTALHLALKSKLQSDFVLAIIGKINAAHLNLEDKEGLTPLQYAVDSGTGFYNKEFIFELINKGCKVNKKIFLFALICCWDAEVIKKLADYVDIKNCIDPYGQNVLHLVQHANLVKFFVRKGALINHRCKQGLTPLFEAINCRKDQKLIESLLLCGAEVDEMVHVLSSSFSYEAGFLDLLVLHGMDVSLKTEYVRLCFLFHFPALNSLDDSYIRHIFISNENVTIPEFLSTDPEFNSLFNIYKREIQKMKQVNIISTTSFYDFCLSEYKSRRCLIDESKCQYMKNDYEKLKKAFPNFYREIIVKIKINIKIKKRKELLNKLLNVSVKKIWKELVNNKGSTDKCATVFDFVELNCDCLFEIGHYLLDHEINSLLTASL